MRVARAAVAGLLSLTILLAAAGTAWAHDVPTFGTDGFRDRTLASTIYTSTYVNPQPFYATVPADPNGSRWQSFSTPVVVGNDVYQYAFDSTGHGVLWEFPVSQPSPSCWAGAAPCIVAWTPVHTWTWDPGYIDGINSAEGVSAPTIRTSATLGQSYTAIGVGQYEDVWPTADPSAALPPAYIQGNPGQTIYQVAESPLLTPAVTWSGLNLSTGATTTWSSPAAVVGSWDGGVVSEPVYTPSGVFVPHVDYRTSEDFGHTGAFTTSSPTWDPATGAVLFGISTPGTLPTYHPRIEVLNPVTGAYHHWGVGDIRASIDVSATYDTHNGAVYVPDQAGNVYAFSGTTGQFYGVNTALSSASWDISDIAVSPYALYAVGKGLTELASLDPANITHINWIDSHLGRGLYSPNVVTNGSTDAIFITSTSGGLTVLKQNGQTLEGAGSPTPAYVSAIADAGPDHWVMSWTNAAPNGQPALQIWPTSAFAMRATLSSTTVLPGQAITITARPTPAPVIASVTVTTPTSTGTGTNLNALTRIDATTWSGTFTAPLAPGTYSVTVTATTAPNSGLSENTAQTLTETLSFTVACDTPHPPTDIQSTLSLPSYSLPGGRDPEPAGDTKLGDTVDAQLSVTASSLAPSCVANPQVTGATLIQAQLYHPYGVVAFTSTSNSETEWEWVPMTVNGMTAQASFLENYAGFPPPPPGQVAETDTIRAMWKAQVTFTYQVPNGSGGWTTKTGQYTVPGTTSAPLSVIGTDWYVIPIPVAGTDQLGP